MEDLPPLEELYAQAMPVEDYSTMTREELIQCCEAHDAHHNEHHDREDRLRALLARAREVLGRATYKLQRDEKSFHGFYASGEFKPSDAVIDGNQVIRDIDAELATDDYTKTNSTNFDYKNKG